MSNGSNGLMYMSAADAGIEEADFTPEGTKYKQDEHGQWIPAFTPTKVRTANQGSSEAQPAFTANDSSFHVVGPVLKQMEDLKARLGQRAGFDERTGELQYLITGRKREILDQEYTHLLLHVLPYQMARGAEADAWLAANPAPGSEDGLRAQLTQQRAFRSRVDALVAEREAEIAAEQAVARRLRG